MWQLKQHYLNILNNGKPHPGRTGSLETPDASICVFGTMLHFDLSNGFPLATSKKVNFKAAINEVCWMLRGQTSTKDLNSPIWDQHSTSDVVSSVSLIPERELFDTYVANGGELSMSDFSTKMAQLGDQCWLFNGRFDFVKINELAQQHFSPFLKDVTRQVTILEKGECGPIYGEQWRRKKGLLKNAVDPNMIQVVSDQIMYVWDKLNNCLHDRDIVVSSWNPTEIYANNLNRKDHSIDSLVCNGLMALPPCHFAFQINVDMDKKLSIMPTMRSSDAAVGLPFNIAAYAFIASIFAAEFDLGVGELAMSLGNAHIYNGHKEGIEEYLKAGAHELPKFNLTKEKLEQIKDEKLDDDVVDPRERFKLFIDNINAEWFVDLLEDYSHEQFIKFDVYK